MDPQGREVHASYATIEEIVTPYGPKRQSKFYPIFKAPPEFAKQALALDRKQALITVQQMRLLDPLDVNFQKTSTK